MPADHVNLLIKLISRFNAPFGLEHSVKLMEKIMITNRVLCSIHINALGQYPSTKLKQLLSDLDFPSENFHLIEKLLSKINILHLGYEFSEGVIIYKCYLEFVDSYTQSIKEKKNNELLVHYAIKWNPVDKKNIRISKYHCQPSFRIS